MTNSISGKAAPRVVSLVPAATDILRFLGVEPIGVSHCCDAHGLPVLTRSIIPDDLSQAEIDDVVREAGGEPKDLVRMTVYVTDKAQYLAATREVGASWRRHVGRSFPAMTLVQVAGLLEDRALVELEATALL